MSMPPVEPYSPIPGPEPHGPNRMILLLAVGLAGFVLVAGLGLVLLLAFSPSVRDRLPFFGAASSSNGAPPEAPDKFANTSGSGLVLIEDDFATASGLWEQSQTRIDDGAYVLRLDQPNYDTYGLFLGASAVRNFDIAVDAAQVGGDPVAEYGIRFRQAGPGDHLMFSISGNGFFRLLRVSDEKYSSAVPWARSEAINTEPGAVNRLRLVADDAQITGYINDVQVLVYRDTVQAAGQLTLGLVTFAQGGLAVRFDNIAGQAEEVVAEGEPDLPPVELAESFEDPASAPWSVGGAEIKDGAYEVFVGGAVQSWQQPLPSGSSEVEGDFVLEVDATLLSGAAGTTAYGLMFGDGGDFDFFTIYLYPEGAIGLFRSEKDGTGGALVEPAQLEAVKQGLDATNTIRIEAKGNILSISINGEAVGDLEFAQEVSFDGMVGLIVNSGDAEGVRARFDNFRLEEAP